jgi:hypothetical protein
VEALEAHHLERADYHQGKAKSMALIKQAILDMDEPDPAAVPERVPGPTMPMMGVTIHPGTKKWNCLDVLSHEGPMPTARLVEMLNRRGFVDSSQSNTSPQLSLYKAKGLIDLGEKGWSITDAGREFLATHKN